jgi:hypothetical protein
MREPDPKDRRRVIVRVRTDVPHRVKPYYCSIKQRLEQGCAEYSEKGIAAARRVLREIVERAARGNDRAQERERGIALASITRPERRLRSF